MWPTSPSQIVVAMILDVVIGDPRRWPHIARYAGALSLAYERWLTHRFHRTGVLGFLFWFLVIGTMLAGYVIIRSVCLLVSPVAGYVFDVIVIYQAIATRDLHQHVKAVLQPLTAGDINAARERLSWIVGRDTETLDQSEISRATIESVAESLVDGIVAPLFWSVIGGAPGALIDGQHDNYYAFADSASNVTISYLTIQHFGTWGGNFDQGVVNIDSAPGWTIDHTTIRNNAGAGVMLGSHDARCRVDPSLEVGQPGIERRIGLRGLLSGDRNFGRISDLVLWRNERRELRRGGGWQAHDQ